MGFGLKMDANRQYFVLIFSIYKCEYFHTEVYSCQDGEARETEFIPLKLRITLQLLLIQLLLRVCVKSDERVSSESLQVKVLLLITSVVLINS